jgi:hypothetical protein
MANEFIARRGLIVLSNGATVTGSINSQGNINASNYSVTASAFSGSFTGSIAGTLVGNAATATALQTARTLWGQSFDGTANVTGNLTSVGNITGTAGVTVTATNGTLNLTATGANPVVINTNGSDRFRVDSAGNVGIGITPLEWSSNYDALQLGGYGSFYSRIADGNQFVGFGNNVFLSSSGLYHRINAGPAAWFEFDYTTLRLFTGSNAAAGSQISNTSIFNLVGGNLGLGVFNPSYKLEVEGTIYASQQVIATSFSGNGSALTLVTASRVANNLTLGNGLTGTSFNGSAAVTATVDTGSAHFITGSVGAMNLRGVLSSSAQVNHNATTNYVANQHIDHTTVSITAGSGLSGGGDISATRTLTLDTGSAHFVTGSVTVMNLRGAFSSSVQTDVRNTTGIATIATTGSNTFTGVQTISDTTNSTLFSNGALVVAGGVGIGRDVNISGSLRVTGLLTAASMSVLYVTSSQVNVGASKIILNDDDNVRFAGISIYDSGSTNATASIFWDSQNHHFIYQNEGIDSYTSGMFIAGPRNTGALGNEEGLISGRIPVASGGDHIDTRLVSSSMRVDFPSRLTHIEAGLYVTGAISSSLGFSGDGSGLTNLVTNLNITGSGGGTSTVALRTQALIVSGTNGIAVTATGQTITVSGSNATTTTRGVAAFTSSHFSVAGGMVSANPITFNGTPLNLGSSYAFGLQNITPQGATTSDQVTLSGGAIISSVLYSSATVSNIIAPANQVVASFATGSYDAARFEYVVKDGTNFRTGAVMAVWRTGTVEYTDTSTNDIGNTAPVVLEVDTTVGGLARLKANVSSGTWTVKTAIKAI